MIAHLQVADPGADLLDDARPLVPADDRQCHAGQISGLDMVVGMAQPGGLERDQDLALLRSVEVDFLDRPRLVESPQHGGVRLHASTLGTRPA